MTTGWRGALAQTRVARRVLTLFVLSAAVPVIALAGLVYYQMTTRLTDQAKIRVQSVARDQTDELLHRLAVLDRELALYAAAGNGRLDGEVAIRSTDTPLAAPFLRMQRVEGPSLTPPAAWGAGAVRWSPGALNSLRAGRTTLVEVEGDSVPRWLLARATAGGPPGYLWAEASPEFVWSFDRSAEDAAVPTRLCVITAANRPLYCADRRVVDALPPGAAGTSGLLEWDGAEGGHIATFRTVFLRQLFGAAPWVLVVSEPRTLVLAPLGRMRRSFVLVMGLGLVIVFGLSHRLIRRSLDPVAELQAATLRLREHDFSQPVEVHTGDEFEDLADSFNGMTRQLANHLNTLEAIAALDHAVLTAPTAASVVETALHQLHELFPGRPVRLALGPTPGSSHWQLHRAGPGGASADGPASAGTAVAVPDAEVAALVARPAGYRLGDPTHLAVLGHGLAPGALVLPLLHGTEPLGALLVEPGGGGRNGEDPMARARHFADQLALVLSHLRLLRDLDDLNWGALTALARTIDAKSPWTAGHSERVTEFAMAIARTLALDESALLQLQRGGLLHDIGKIGVSSGILNSPAALTEAEMAEMRRHPEIGARILAPISAYASVIPIVLYHHERWDGSGYPEGLVGEAIPYLARLLAVADVFDALTSHRPYRSGWTVEAATAYIVRAQGTMFDASIVAGFQRWVARGGIVVGADRAPDLLVVDGAD